MIKTACFDHKWCAISGTQRDSNDLKTFIFLRPVVFFFTIFYEPSTIHQILPPFPEWVVFSTYRNENKLKGLIFSRRLDSVQADFR